MEVPDDGAERLTLIRPPASVDVHSGPLLLSGIDRGPGPGGPPRPARRPARAERRRPWSTCSARSVCAAAAAPASRWRASCRPSCGPAARAARLGGRRPYVVVNAAEGEPASAKDSALLDVAPHLVLDGAVVAARALGAREIHVSARRTGPGSVRPCTGPPPNATTTASAGCSTRPPRASCPGQSRAIIELMAGRPGLPVTSWAPEAVDGHRRRPTLLSNAESFAHLAAVVLWGVDGYAGHGTPDEPGTSLLTLTTPPAADGVFRGVHVVEVEHGDGAATVLDAAALAAPLLVGGFHGSWVHPRDVPAWVVDRGARRGRAPGSAPARCCR